LSARCLDPWASHVLDNRGQLSDSLPRSACPPEGAVGNPTRATVDARRPPTNRPTGHFAQRRAPGRVGLPASPKEDRPFLRAAARGGPRSVAVDIWSRTGLNGRPPARSRDGARATWQRVISHRPGSLLPDQQSAGRQVAAISLRYAQAAHPATRGVQKRASGPPLQWWSRGSRTDWNAPRPSRASAARLTQAAGTSQELVARPGGTWGRTRRPSRSGRSTPPVGPVR